MFDKLRKWIKTAEFKLNALFMASSLMFMGIGISTLTYKDSLYFNPAFVGGIQIIAGIAGALHIAKVIKNRYLVNNIVLLAIAFRIFCFLLDITFGQFTAARLNGVFIWMLMGAGFTIMNLLIEDLLKKDTQSMMQMEANYAEQEFADHQSSSDIQKIPPDKEGD